MKDHPVPADFAALIGIDWADKKHDHSLHSKTGTNYNLPTTRTVPNPIHPDIVEACPINEGLKVCGLDKHDTSEDSNAVILCST